MTKNQSAGVGRLSGGVRFGPKDEGPIAQNGFKSRRTFGTTIDSKTYEEFVRVSALHNLRVSEILDTLVSTGVFRATAEEISKS